MIVPHSWHGGASDSCAHVPCRLIALPAGFVSTTTVAATGLASSPTGSDSCSAGGDARNFRPSQRKR